MIKIVFLSSHASDNDEVSPVAIGYFEAIPMIMARLIMSFLD